MTAHKYPPVMNQVYERMQRRLWGVALLCLIPFLAVACTTSAQEPDGASAPASTSAAPNASELPSPYPDRIVLTWSADPSSSLSVSWRTDTSVSSAEAQIAVAKAEPSFDKSSRSVTAITEPFPGHDEHTEETVKAHYHSVTFDELEPATQYAYRVGDGTRWSEWFHARTGSAKAAPFSFIYMGDAQNGIGSQWPRAIRAAYAQASNAAFTVHAGDLVDRAHRDLEWGQWNRGGSWVLSMLPNIPVPGNHEHEAIGEEATVEQTLTLDASRTQEGSDSQLRGSVGLPNGETAPFSATRAGDTSSSWAGNWSFQIAGSAYQGTLKMSEDGGALSGALIADEAEQLDLRDVQVQSDQLTAAFSVELPDPGQEELSLQWRPQFTLPENGPAGMEETVYYLDFQGMRIIALNSNIRDEAQLRQQTEWLASVLESSDARWTAVTFHHPVFSSAEGRSNEHLRTAWKPLFDKYQVDLVMQGHDHTYARGQVQNLAQGANARVPASGTVYVNSVSGSKMYEIKDDRWDRFEDVEMQRGAENTQLYQVIHVEQDTMEYRSYTVTGELYDAFDLVKQENGLPNELVERPTTVREERTHENTIAYD